MPRKGENIHKRKDGRWEGRFLVCDFEAGTKKYKSIYGKTYTEVKKQMTIAKAGACAGKMPAGKISPKTEPCFDEIASLWLEYVKKEKKQSTYIKYRTVYDTHMKKLLGKKRIREITAELSDSLYESCKSDSMRKSLYCVLRQILTCGNEKFKAESCPVGAPKLQKRKAETEAFTRAEQVALLRALYHEMDSYKLAVLLCLSTGLRIGEVCALKWSDIDFQGRLLYVNRTAQRLYAENQATKTVLFIGTPKSVTSKREIPIPDNLVHLLRYMKNNGDYVIKPDNATEPRTLQNHFQKCLKEAGIEKRKFHVLRHTFATNCMNAGVDIKSLSEILGHASVQITLDRYVHSTIDTKRHHLNHLYSIYGQYLGQKCS